MESFLARHLSIVLCHSSLDGTSKAQLRLVCKFFRREVDAHLRSLHLNFRAPELDFSRFPQLTVVAIARSPLATALPVLQACPALTELRCTAAQLHAADLISYTQVTRLSVVRDGGEAPPSAELLAQCRLTKYRLEFELDAPLSEKFCDRLEALDLEGHEQARITTVQLKMICSSPQLSVLRLSHCLEGVVKPLTIIARMGGQLRELDVSFNLRCMDFEADVVALNALTNLVKLNLSFSRLSSGAVVGLTALAGLKELRASSCQMHTAHMPALASAFPMLTFLDISGSWELTEFSKELGPDALPHLRSLQLNYSTNMRYLTPLQGVRELNLAGTSPSQGVLWALEAMTGLQSLDVSNFSPHNLLSHRELTFVTKMQQLDCLMLGGASRFGDEGVGLLTQLGALTQLELSGCGVTAVGVNSLNSLSQLSTLRVDKCPQLDIGEVEGRVGLAIYSGHRHQGFPGAAHLGLLPN